MSKDKMNWAETQSMDVSAAYQQGKIAHQRGVLLGDNPWSFGTEFNKYWAQGWTDAEALQNPTKDGYQG